MHQHNILSVLLFSEFLFNVKHQSSVYIQGDSFSVFMIILAFFWLFCFSLSFEYSIHRDEKCIKLEKKETRGESFIVNELCKFM